MARRKQNRRSTPTKTPDVRSTESAPNTVMLSRRKRWFYRALLAVGGPAVFLLLCEIILRAGGYGYATSFLVPVSMNGAEALAPNQKFAWRFFGPNFARQPATFAITPQKAANTVRVFVFGESAAFGDPQPDFGLPRMLQTMLSLRHPGTRFEVVNAAMTGINSHAVLPIARDCAQADGDIWVIYMGNNEVVGPFGAGTVFGPQSPGAAIIRSNLAIRTMRVGQLLASLQESMRRPPESKSEWGGMLMFLENQVRYDDPRMARVYQHFERNLSEILAAAEACGAGVVVSTVAVNLRDCAPFASLHRSGLANDALEKWQRDFRAGSEAQKSGDHAEAGRHFAAASQLDNNFADLQFAWGQSLAALGKQKEATAAFSLARDFDVLRFRGDSTLNGIIRRVARGREKDHILLADAEEAFARESAEGVPGAKYFYEHVHLTFEGNYLLAKTIGEHVERLLPDRIRSDTSIAAAWPTADECARRLAWTDWHRLTAVNDMLGRLGDRPFTNQANNREQIRRLGQQAEQLRAPAQQALASAMSSFDEALQAAPDDPALHAQLAAMLGRAGDAKAAIPAARRAIELLPINSEYWMLLGAALATDQQYALAAEAFESAYQNDDQNFWALQSLARVYSKLDRRQEAIETYQQAIGIKPRFGPAYLELGQLLETMGRKDEAERNYQQALENRIYRPAELAALAQFCQQRGWHNEALRNYADAIKLSPFDAALHLNAGGCLAALQKHAEARQHFEAAVRLAPEFGEARFLLGVELGRANESAAAIEQFREAVRLMPNLPEARLNLGIALKTQGHRAEALAQFQQVLQQSPNNAVALDQIRQIETESNGSSRE